MEPRMISHYRLIDHLGKGGMGEVFLAQDTMLDRKVAIKLLPEGTDPDPKARKRLMREARAAAALHHPYICNIYEVGESDDQPFIVMEYVEGETLRERIDRGPVFAEEAIRLALEVAEAVQEAHDQGIIHRDLKPANIMLTRNGHAKIMDFGLAKRIPADRGAQATLEESLSTVTLEGTTAGTVVYMSPEQLKGGEVDGRSDIFTFGIVLHEMLTGVHPFQKEAPLATAASILYDPPRQAGGSASPIPESLEQVLARMLLKEPGQRFQSMRDVRAALAQPAGVSRKAVRAVRPRRQLRLAAAGLGLILALTAAWWVKDTYFASPAAALAFAARDWILIADFENLTGEEIFDNSLETALTVSMQQSQHVNVFPRSRVEETLRRMRLTGVTKIDEATGRNVALREGIKGLLAGSISRVGGEYLLSARIVDPANTMTVFSHAVRAGDSGMVLSALDELAQTVREKLGESMSRISSGRVPLLQATTSSLEALKLFSEARLSGRQVAPGLLRRAVELDPDFAMAHADLGFQYYIANNREKGEEHFQKALGLLDRLTSREKLWIRALVDDWRGQREQGIEKYRAYLAQYPDDSRGWFRLGYAYLVTRQFSPCAAAFERVIAIDPEEAAAYVNLATCNSGSKEKDKAVENYRRAFEIRPEMALEGGVNHEYGFLLAGLGHVGEAAELFERMANMETPLQRARGRRSLALLQMYQGKYSSAGRHLADAIQLNKAAGFRLSEFRDRLYLSALLLMKREETESGRQLAEARRIQKELNVEPAFLQRLGKILARQGDLAGAAQVLDQLRVRIGDVRASSGLSRSDQTDKAYFHLLQGEVWLLQRRYDEALQSFWLGESQVQNEAAECLAHAYAEKGDTDSAIGKYREFIQAEALGNELQEAWILAHYRLGQLLERRGETAEARTYYDRFAEIWREADPDLVPLQEAKKRLTALPQKTQ